jgi:hypothetical protein
MPAVYQTGCPVSKKMAVTGESLTEQAFVQKLNFAEERR